MLPTLVLFLPSLVLGPVMAERTLQVNCSYPQIVGSWRFNIGQGGHDNTIDCQNFGTHQNPEVKSLHVTLYFPNYVMDADGNEGHWILIDNQGFEVVVGDRKYFAFSGWRRNKQHHLENICNKTMIGWSHDVDGHDWACYVGHKIGQQDMAIGASLEHLISQSSSITAEQLKEAAVLPESFDWRDVNGVNYVPDVKDQGCHGGFAYLIGKYADDFGLVLEDCNKYTARSGNCSLTARNECPRYHANNYEYLGGFFGACNEPLMRINLVRHGPISVGIRAYNDFKTYKSGIYHHIYKLGNKFDPYQETTHAVTIVGYGTDRTRSDSSVDYWIVQNSYGVHWGEQGYIRMRRGINECAIESMAMQAFPVL